MRKAPKLAALCALAVALAACSSAPPARLYTLGAAAAPAAPAAALPRLSVAVGPVGVPASVDRPQIVVRTGANEIALSESGRWAAPLQENLARVLADDLVAALGTSRVTLFGQNLDAPADYRVQVEVRNFESTLAQQAALDAVWNVRRAKDGRIDTGRTNVREAVDGDGFAALAAAHSRAAARLAQDVADAIRALEAAPAK